MRFPWAGCTRPDRPPRRKGVDRPATRRISKAEIALWALHYLMIACWVAVSVKVVGPRVILVALAAAPMGGLGAVRVSERRAWRSLRLSRRAAAAKGARWGTVMGVLWLNALAACLNATVGISALSSHLAWAVASGALAGLLGGMLASFLTPAERAFARASRRLKAGDREGARRAAMAYLDQAEGDPLRAARAPVAQAFLRGQRDSLDVSWELEAAPAPGGRGVELEATAAPEGRGVELVAADVPHTPGSEAERQDAGRAQAARS